MEALVAASASGGTNQSRRKSEGRIVNGAMSVILPLLLPSAWGDNAINLQSKQAVDLSQPFADVRVVEFGQFVSAPFCGQLLAEGGAEVIKVEPLTGDPARQLRQIVPGETRIFLSRNRGKRSLPLALRHPGARAVIDRLLRQADVALMNFRPGLAEQLGLDAPTLARRFERLIVGSVTGFGTKGPEASYSAMDPVVQARSGLMAVNGRLQDGRPTSGDPVVADYMCAMTLAFGVSAALLRRERTGVGGSVDVSLMQAAMTLANNQLIRSETADAPRHERILAELSRLRRDGAGYAEQAATMTSARTAPMLRIYLRTYDTADAPISIACGSHSLRRKFLDVLDVEDPLLDKPEGEGHQDHYDRFQAEVEAIIRARPAEHWIARLNDAGVPVSPVKFPVELFDDEQATANGMFHRLRHPDAGDFTVLSPPVALDGDGFRSRKATAPFASETRTILRELDFSDAEIDTLAATEVTRTRPR